MLRIRCLGLSDESVVGLSDDRFAWDASVRFPQMLGNVGRADQKRFIDLLSRDVLTGLDAHGG